MKSGLKRNPKVEAELEELKKLCMENNEEGHTPSKKQNSGDSSQRVNPFVKNPEQPEDSELKDKFNKFSQKSKNQSSEKKRGPKKSSPEEEGERPGSGTKGNTGDDSTSVTPTKQETKGNKRRTIDQVSGSKEEKSKPSKRLKTTTLMSYFQKKPAE